MRDTDFWLNRFSLTAEAVLHARVSEMTSKVAELQLTVEMEKQKYEVERSSKVECQAQLGRLVRELQAMRREQRLVQERNMEQLRLQYIAREERYVLDGDRQELRSIKNELDDLKRVSLMQVEREGREEREKRGERGMAQQAPTPSRSSAIQRFQKERRDLISTGAYDRTHPIIQSLDMKIRQEVEGGDSGMRDASA